jgi:hypothetical protein
MARVVVTAVVTSSRSRVLLIDNFMMYATLWPADTSVLFQWVGKNISEILLISFQTCLVQYTYFQSICCAICVATHFTHSRLIRFAVVSCGRFKAMHYKFNLSTYVQEILVMCRRGCMGKELKADN